MKSFLLLVLAPILLVGCASPIARLALNQPPIRSEVAEASVKEVIRGPNGGVVTIEVTNISGSRLDCINGSRATLMADSGLMLQNLDMNQFSAAIHEHSPIGFGLTGWSHSTPPVQLEPLVSRVNLEQGNRAVIQIAFAAPHYVRSLTVDLAPALAFRGPDGQMMEATSPLRVLVPLPKVAAGPPWFDHVELVIAH